mgnify:FL=1
MVGDGASGASKLTGQVAQIIAQMPDILESLGGIDVKKFLKKLEEKNSSGEVQEGK